MNRDLGIWITRNSPLEPAPAAMATGMTRQGSAKCSHPAYTGAARLRPG